MTTTTNLSLAQFIEGYADGTRDIGLRATTPDGVSCWHSFLEDVAGRLSEYRLDSDDDISTATDEISDPDSWAPYYTEKWQLMTTMSLWASTDLQSDVDELANGMDEPLGGYLMGMCDLYIYTAIRWAIQEVLECARTAMSQGFSE